MSKFQLFDAVILKEALKLNESVTAPKGTQGAVVEILQNGEAYLVELFGQWVKATDDGSLIEVSQDDPEAFRSTLDVETIYPYQIDKQETVKLQLLQLLDSLPEETLIQVKDFAEFLSHKQKQPV